MPIYLFWIILAALLLIAELLTGTFYLLILSLGAVTGIFAAQIDLSLANQIALAVFVSLLGFIALLKFKKKPKFLDNDLDIGQTVIWLGKNKDTTWKVKYRGTEWQAQPINNKTNPNEELIICEVKANVLIVQNIEEN